MTAASFTRRGAIVVASMVAVSMAATMFLSVYGDALFTPTSAAADAWSRSALGHHAFLELVRRRGRVVVVSRARTAEKATTGAPTALLEPRLGEEDPRAEGRLDEIGSSAGRLLVVLPKREGIPDFERRGWIAHERLLPPEDVDRVLEALELEATVFRPARRAEAGAWKGSLPAPALRDPQLVRSEALTPLLATEEGILVGALETEDRRLVLVADPDLLETHGLGRGENAAIALAALDRLGGEATLIVDETLHGWELEPSIVQELLRFPLALATLQAAVTLALLAWAALVRFGRPVPPAPLLRAGKEFLVQNVADMLRAGGHAKEAARAYLRAAREEVLARIPPPGGAETPEAWLLRLEAARGRAGELASLTRQVEAIGERRRGAGRGAEVEAVRAARRIQRWREELTHGAAGDPREARGRPG
ncbi:MAG TPA: DUF4350 domain-containing protein [Anaeromyxobacter sp.]|nr:DUF4350 domain-containing protein [Anaeromyxobacter sp.]